MDTLTHFLFRLGRKLARMVNPPDALYLSALPPHPQMASITSFLDFLSSSSSPLPSIPSTQRSKWLQALLPPMVSLMAKETQLEKTRTRAFQDGWSSSSSFSWSSSSCWSPFASGTYGRRTRSSRKVTMIGKTSHQSRKSRTSSSSSPRRVTRKKKSRRKTCSVNSKVSRSLPHVRVLIHQETKLMSRSIMNQLHLYRENHRQPRRERHMLMTQVTHLIDLNYKIKFTHII